MRRLLVLLALGSAAPALAQPAAPTVESAGRCPTEITVGWDVSSIAGASGARLRVRRGNQNVDTRSLDGPTGTAFLDLRTLDRPVLEGSQWSVQVRARDGGTNLGDWSPLTAIELPEDAPYDAFSLAPDGNRIRLTWDLAQVSLLRSCADRIAWEIKAGEFADPGLPDPAATAGVELSAAGSKRLPNPAGGGTDHVRIVARHGGNGPENDVGSWSRAKTLDTVEDGGSETLAFRVRVLDADATRCARHPVPRTDAVVTLHGPGGPVTTLAVGPDGVASITDIAAPGAGSFEFVARGSVGDQRCEASVPAVANGEVELPLLGCLHPDGDRSVTFDAGSVLRPRVPVRLSVTLRNVSGLVAPAGHVSISRVAPDGTRTGLAGVYSGGLCAGETRTFTATDTGAGLASEVVYEARATVGDANPVDDVATLRLRSTLPAGRPAPGSPLGDRNPSGPLGDRP